jgi:tRNA pseudouridine synthase 10
MGAGREDMDVRMLGEGRPFILQMDECRTIKLESLIDLENELKAIESPIILVRDLQMVDKYGSALNF